MHRKKAADDVLCVCAQIDHKMHSIIKVSHLSEEEKAKRETNLILNLIKVNL